MCFDWQNTFVFCKTHLLVVCKTHLCFQSGRHWIRGKRGDIMWAPLKTVDLEKILFRDRCWRNVSNFILIPTWNCKRGMNKTGKDLVGFLVLGSNLSYFSGRISYLVGSNFFFFFEKRSKTIILIPSFDLLLPNFNQIVRKWESFLALFSFLKIEMLRHNPISSVSLTNDTVWYYLILFDTVWYYLILSDIIVSDSDTIISDSDTVTISDTVTPKNTYLALSDAVRY